MKTNLRGVGLHDPDWPSEGIGVAPPTGKPEVDLCRAQSGYCSPFVQRPSLPIVGQKLGGSFVSGLHFGRNPSAIARFVISVYVNAVNRVLATWRFAHVSEECLKAVAPPIAHGYTTPTVNGVIRAGWVVAPSLDVFPCAVFLCSDPAQVSPLPMSHVVSGNKFAPQAAAGLSESVREAGSDNSFFRSATANACPLRNGTFVVNHSMLHQQTTERAPRKINKLWHFFTLKWLTVMGAWQAAVNSFSGATLAKQFDFNRGML